MKRLNTFAITILFIAMGAANQSIAATTTGTIESVKIMDLFVFGQYVPIALVQTDPAIPSSICTGGIGLVGTKLQKVPFSAC
ncbi:MAG: hypothetical protein AAF542_19270 [Pseudomonadota bacterium]